MRELDLEESTYHLLPFEKVHWQAKLKKQHFRTASAGYRMIELAVKP